MPTVYACPLSPKLQYELADGLPAVGNQLFFYVAGSSTKLDTYTDSTGTVANTNPLILNSLGFPTTEIWLQGLAYKVVYAPATDTDPPTSPIWTIDNLRGINDTSVSIDQWVPSGLTPTYLSAVSFSLVGDQTTAFHVGRRLKTTNSGGTIYSTIAKSAFSVTTSVGVVNDSGVLDSGLSAVSYGLISAANTSEPAIGDTYVCTGRLTLTTGVPITTADVTAAETVYFTPFRGDKIDLYDATDQRWVRYPFSELSLDVPDATQVNDVFIYNNGGSLTLEAVAWSTTTARATALVTQNGVLVKSGATGRRYLGSFYATTAGNGQTEDSLANRLLWNYYNRVPRPMEVKDTTNTWAYSTATIRQANGAVTNQLAMVRGVEEDAATAVVTAHLANDDLTARAVAIGVGVDSTTVFSGESRQFITYNTSQTAVPNASYYGFPGLGYHFLAWLERGAGAGTQTWSGDNGGALAQSGIAGWVMA